jgi:F0F1-type ATP synthase assembly protein I
MIMKAWWKYQKTGKEAEVMSFFGALCSLLGAVLGLIVDHQVDVRPVASGLIFLILGLLLKGNRTRRAVQAAQAASR